MTVMIRRIIILSVLALASGCSPFGQQSLVENLTQPISAVLSGKTNVEIISGGSQTEVTNDNYSVTTSVGSSFEQAGTETADGYKVYTNIQGSITQ